MSLEFGGKKKFEAYSKKLEDVNSSFSVLESMSQRMLEQNGQQLEFIRQSQELSSKIEMDVMSEYGKSAFKETSVTKSLEKLKKRCGKAKTIEDIKKIKADYDSLMKPIKEARYASALNQTGINAKAGIVTERTTSDLPKIAETVVEQSTTAKKTQDVIKFNKADILEEASKRTQQEKMATEIAEKAQKYYSSISDVTTGKSAKESAEVIETALRKADKEKIAQEAIKRTQQEKMAAEIAENAQKYYTSISDVTTGKSAKESAEFFETAMENNEIKKNISNNINDKTSKYADKLKNLYSEKITPILKSKKFKVVAIGTILTAITAGIIKHNKNKKEENSKLNTIK